MQLKLRPRRARRVLVRNASAMAMPARQLAAKVISCLPESLSFTQESCGVSHTRTLDVYVMPFSSQATATNWHCTCRTVHFAGAERGPGQRAARRRQHAAPGRRQPRSR
jgi:hypothetical protein